METFHDFGEIKQILYISFNQDFSCISIGTDEGYLIYNVEPIKLIFEKSK